MRRLPIYIVSVQRIDDWELVEDDVRVYHFKKNAQNDFKQEVERMKRDYAEACGDEDFNWHVSCDSDTHYEAGIEGNYSKESCIVRLIDSKVLDYVSEK